MTKPIRIRLSRKKGFDLQAVSRAANGLPAVNVARPSRWGNPFDFRASDFCWIALSFGCRADRIGRQKASVLAFREWITAPPGMRVGGLERGVAIGNDDKGYVDIGPRVKVGPAPTHTEIVDALRLKNLSCWCPLVLPDGAPCPCHADVLLEIANAD